MKSMTGYGYREYQDEKMTMSLELKSYNNRYLDVYVNLPGYLSPLEPGIRDFLSSRIGRGKVECGVRIREMEEDITVQIDRSAVSGFLQALTELKQTAGLAGEITMDQLLGMEGVLKIQKNRDLDVYGELILGRLEEVFAEFEASRIREGEHTQKDILSSLDVLASRTELFVSRSGELEEELKTTLRERFAALLEDRYDENRVLAETAVLLMKYSINEEIVRLSGHIAGFRKAMETGSAGGKKLDFLCQEMGREINTIGSKSTQSDVIQGVVDCKDHLERIREQLRNLE